VKIFNTQNTLSKPTYQNKKNTWFVLENLKFEICSINPSIDTDEIFKASWFERELKAFKGFNEGRNHSDYDMVRFFAEWMLKARAKYAKMKTPAPRQNNYSNGQSAKPANQIPEVITFASEKQLFAFARRLVNHPDFKDTFCHTGESWMDAGKRMAQKLVDPQEQKPFIPYLIEMGFKNSSKETAA
ncbi:TPA: hypothetical protein JI397_RS03140, partial [Acinetobacter baumannii]|nr:hypothetical protein [Acinetobacter baumannii]